MTLETVRAAYGARAAEYVALLGRIDHAAEADRRFVLDWARTVDGRILDVGSGPGQWTDLLCRAGHDAAGVEPVPEFLDSARAAYPSRSYRSGRAEELDEADSAVGGILSWYSLIHTAPDEIGIALAEFARCLAPDGGLALGFFTGARLEPFDHAVTRAYFWPVEMLIARVESAGFRVTRTETRNDPGARPHGALLARRAH